MGLFSELFGGGNIQKGEGPQKASAAYFSRETSYRQINLVSESRYQDEIRDVTGRQGDEALDHSCIGALVAETDNEFDPNAIHVQVDGYKVGYLSREDAAEYRGAAVKADRQGEYVAGDARIAAVEPERADTPNAGVVIWLPSPAELLKDL